jgi:tripartite-type tricarboxylate transporter receptor subunit TctC
MVQLPDVPAITEVLPGYEINSWFGVLAPANVPKPIADRLSTEFAKALQAPDVRERLMQQGFTIVGSTPEQFGAHLRDDVNNWKRIADIAGVKPE